MSLVILFEAAHTDQPQRTMRGGGLRVNRELCGGERQTGVVRGENPIAICESILWDGRIRNSDHQSSAGISFLQRQPGNVSHSSSVAALAAQSARGVDPQQWTQQVPDRSRAQAIIR